MSITSFAPSPVRLPELIYSSGQASHQEGTAGGRQIISLHVPGDLSVVISDFEERALQVVSNIGQRPYRRPTRPRDDRNLPAVSPNSAGRALHSETDEFHGLTVVVCLYLIVRVGLWLSAILQAQEPIYWHRPNPLN